MANTDLSKLVNSSEWVDALIDCFHQADQFTKILDFIRDGIEQCDSTDAVKNFITLHAKKSKFGGGCGDWLRGLLGHALATRCNCLDLHSLVSVLVRKRTIWTDSFLRRKLDALWSSFDRTPMTKSIQEFQNQLAAKGMAQLVSRALRSEVSFTEYFSVHDNIFRMDKYHKYDRHSKKRSER